RCLDLPRTLPAVPEARNDSAAPIKVDQNGRGAFARKSGLCADVPFGIAVGGISRDQMADPAKGSARTDPKARRDDQPKDAAQKLAVIDLSHAGYQKTQDRRIARFLHFLLLEPTGASMSIPS